MKKGFTLIELLAVIIILAVVALIATPIVLDVVKDAKESARRSSVALYADDIKLVITEHHFKSGGVNPMVNNNWVLENVDQNNKITCNNIFNSEYGVLLHECTVGKDTANYCYAKNQVYDCENSEYQEIYENNYAGGKEPKVELELTVEPNSNGWLNQNFFVAINANGTSYEYCVSTDRCTPNSLVKKQSGHALVDIESDNIYVCAKSTNVLGSSETTCGGPYKLDKKTPNMTAKEGPYEVNLGANYNTIGFFNEPEYGISGGSVVCNPANTLTLVAGTHKVTCISTSNNGLTNTHEIDVFVKQNVFEFNYTGGVQTFTALEAGTYKLEVYGAQGGDDTDNNGKNKTSGGYGGYSSGNVTLSQGQKLYVVVGGRGSPENYSNGGYNGGGHGTSSSGGGATHIAKETGILNLLSQKQSSVLIVAGGGGGSYVNGDGTDRYTGGAGGGLNGGSARGWISTLNTCDGATQTGGASFGFGGSRTSGAAAGGGGGGWYGGKICGSNGAGTGGSGYIGGVTNGTTSGNVRGGNGYAKITLLD